MVFVFANTRLQAIDKLNSTFPAKMKTRKKGNGIIMLARKKKNACGC